MATSPRKTKSTPGNFGGFANDANRIAMQYANAMQSQDATASPVASPVTNMSGSGVALTVPQNAVSIVLYSSVTVLAGEDSTFTNGFTIPATTVFEIELAKQAFLYLKPSSSTNTINFYFKIV
jgi:hypothetical protein